MSSFEFSDTTRSAKFSKVNARRDLSAEKSVHKMILSMKCMI
jgi:hypothetical protein